MSPTPAGPIIHDTHEVPFMPKVKTITCYDINMGEGTWYQLILFIIILFYLLILSQVDPLSLLSVLFFHLHMCTVLYHD